MFAWLVLLFTVLPALEIWVFFQIPMTLASKLLIVLFTGIAGASLARAQGWKVLREVQDTLAAGGLPTRELLHGAIVLFGGALLLTPGFITDFVGFSCLLPPTRALIAAGLSRYFKGRVQVHGANSMNAGGFTFTAGRPRPGPGAQPAPRRIREQRRPPRPSEPGRVDLGAHVGRPPPTPRTIDASFSVVDDDDES